MCHHVVSRTLFVLTGAALGTVINASVPWDMDTWTDLYGLTRTMTSSEVSDYEYWSRCAWNYCTHEESENIAYTYASLSVDSVEMTWQGIVNSLPSPTRGRRLGGGGGGSVCQKNTGNCERCDDNEPPCEGNNCRRQLHLDHSEEEGRHIDSLPYDQEYVQSAVEEVRRELTTTNDFDSCLCQFLKYSNFPIFHQVHTCRTYICEGTGCSTRIPVSEASGHYFKDSVETSGNACCSHTLDSCMSWCGTTEADCGKICPSEPIKPLWLPNGPQTSTCRKRWDGCADAPDSCCAPASCVWINPWYSQCMTAEEMPPPTNGCCSHDFKTCVYWCGTTKEECGQCDTELAPVWFDDGPKGESDTCVARFEDCQPTSQCCSPGTCTQVGDPSWNYYQCR